MPIPLTLIIVGVIAIAAVFAIRFIADIFTAGEKTERVSERQEGRSDRTATRQGEQTERTEARHEDNVIKAQGRATAKVIKAKSSASKKDTKADLKKAHAACCKRKRVMGVAVGWKDCNNKCMERMLADDTAVTKPRVASNSGNTRTVTIPK